jgi:hypothetical protein
MAREYRRIPVGRHSVLSRSRSIRVGAVVIVRGTATIVAIITAPEVL